MIHLNSFFHIRCDVYIVFQFLFARGCSVFPSLLVEETIFSSTELFFTVFRISWLYLYRPLSVSFCLLDPVPLFHWCVSILLIIPQCLDYCSVIVSLKVKCFSKIISALSVSLPFCKYLRISLSISTKTPCWDSRRNLGRIGIFTLSSLLTHEHRTLLHLFRFLWLRWSFLFVISSL